MRTLTIPAYGTLPGVVIADPEHPTDEEDIAHNAEVNRLIRVELDAAIEAGETPPVCAVHYPDSPVDMLTLDSEGNLVALLRGVSP